MRSITYTVPAEYSGKKLVSYLKNELEISARLLTKLKKEQDGMMLNGGHIRSVDTVYGGDILTLNMPDEEGNIPEGDFSALDIVFEDEDIIVVNKPSGLAMHPTHNHQGDTLANMLSGYFASKGKHPVFRAVGRLDKCTSGLVICALNRRSAFVLSGKVHKEYIAVAGGCFSGSGTIDKPIYRPDAGKTLRAAGECGERAVTHWEAKICDGEKSVLRIKPETGRTHQIRVHFASVGAPLVGDEMYGSEDFSVPRTALHCFLVSFAHPVTREAMSFEAPLPEDMLQTVKQMQKNKACK